MKLLLVNNSGEQLACLEDVEEYSVGDPSRVFAMLDVLETLIAAAGKGRDGAVGKARTLFAGRTGQIAV